MPAPDRPGGRILAPSHGVEDRAPAAPRPRRRAALRHPAFAGRVYQVGAGRLTEQLDGYFRSSDGAGLPDRLAPRVKDEGTTRLRAVVTPHIDFQRGGPVYSWAYRRLVEESDAEVFVILGVAHQYCRSRFVLTRDDFATPLGPVRTDQEFIDRLVEATDAPLFQDEAVHDGEHSIEFQAVFLKHALGDRPFTIVPILVGSFHDLVRRRVDPAADPEIARFIAALQAAERAGGKKTAYIGSVDLCHVGPEFGDSEPVGPEFQGRIRSFDRSMLERAEAVDPAGWFRTASDVGDRWRVCGLSATYTMLHAIGPARGEILRYGQAVGEGGRSCVTFASMAFRESAPDPD